MKLWAIVLCVSWMCAPSVMAKIYRWTDEAGRIHFTDNPATIPPAHREPHHELAPSTPSKGSQGAAPNAQPATTPSATTKSPEASAPEPAHLLQQQASTLEQQIAATLQERRTYLDQLKAVRDIRTNPAFGRKRRRVDTWGRSLAMVEQRLDTLYAALHQIQAKILEIEQKQRSVSPPQPSLKGGRLDAQGHDALYWRQRAETVHERLTNVREQRQVILGRLASAPQEEGRSFGRRAAEVLQQVQALEQIDQKIRAAEAALQSLRQEATRAGAPAAWLQ